MKKPDILVVEDDTDIQQLVSYNLIRSGYNVTCADSGEEALELLKKESFDAMILDLMLPGMDGMEICTAVRTDEKTRSLPVIMLTAKGEEDDIVAGLECGADDYVTKPFSPRVLIARVEAALRRKPVVHEDQDSADEEVISLHSMQIHPGRHEVLLDGQPIHLTTTEFTILELLARRPGWVYTRQQIIDQIRGYDYLITPRAVDVQIFGLRKKLGTAGKWIETIRGIGYRMREL
ncbi:DNA-binding response regulator [Desulfolithobacter dissulfuricans]|uniref:DNA-binding response regulator n=1 Tax=Desulfolithobacter dissulfuricans TaxID=2795293 RepID=A0A915XL14_9BACT|nr:response regulator transcription factor [Desulfolithobacter dissulfuricans]BCO10767.1 DNA-binding response regulator [Desulfolithobacter dissulfuricans]